MVGLAGKDFNFAPAAHIRVYYMWFLYYIEYYVFHVFKLVDKKYFSFLLICMLLITSEHFFNVQ